MTTLETCIIPSGMSSDLRDVFVMLLQEPQPIDWEYYRKGIGAKVVDMYKEAYDSMCFLYSLFNCISGKLVCYEIANKLVLI